MDLESLKELIADHSARPRNRRASESSTHFCRGKNPLCGDEIQLALTVSNDLIEEITFLGNGCGISQASASILTESIKGLSTTDAIHLYERLHATILDHSSQALDASLATIWTEIEPLAEIRINPMRVKCVTLAWHTLHHALKGQSTTTTED